MSKDVEKKIAAEKSVEYIENGMIIGIGTGSTVKYMIESLAEKVNKGLNVTAVTTSKVSEDFAKSLGINVVDIDQVKEIDLTIDGADEFDKDLNGIKGGGGALLYEKIVAAASRKNIWITDSAKFVKKLGSFPLPVEVVPFGAEKVFYKFQCLGYSPNFRMVNDSYFITDGGHFIIDLHLKEIENPYELNKQLNLLPGVIETGLFLDIADLVIIGRDDSREIIERDKKKTNL
ncbi:ribose-5-phosphate isomerase A [bacterium BMS3Abin03]|nr:ribose-5-phosphate isomerase A [bacterium BMS3Abin03]